MNRMGKKNLKINFYKLYRQVTSYADALRASLSVWGKNQPRPQGFSFFEGKALGTKLRKERVTKFQKTSAWEANEQASVVQRLESAIHRMIQWILQLVSPILIGWIALSNV